jgi:hypothetical protein
VNEGSDARDHRQGLGERPGSALVTEHALSYFQKSVDVAISGESHSCPVCGLTEFSAGGSYEICGNCGWEDDPVQLAEPDFVGGANRMSLNQARDAWKQESA